MGQDARVRSWGSPLTDKQVYLEIKYLGIYGLSLLIAAARIYRPASSPAIQLLDDRKRRPRRDVTRVSATNVRPQEDSFVPSPNLILGSVRPCDLWTVTAHANRKGNCVRGLVHLEGTFLVVQFAIVSESGLCNPCKIPKRRGVDLSSLLHRSAT